MNHPANHSDSEQRFPKNPSDSHTRVRVTLSGDGALGPADGSSRSTSIHRPVIEVPPAMAIGGDEKTVISKRPPVVEKPVPRPALKPFELGRELEGRRLSHFQLEQFVGGGGMGAVFRATDTMLGRTVAVKVLSRDQTDEETVRRFQNEAQSAARLDHPNIARVYYVGEDQGLNYIVFEFIEGENIRDLVVSNGPLPVDEAINYTLQVAEALEHAARRDVVHRDIKPSNLLVMPDGHVKLVDMGLARLHQVETSAADLTESGVTLGTFDYISPEQARDPRSADVRSDLYSLGCTLFFMLTGRPPFPDGTVLQKLLSHSSDAPPDLRTLRPDVPPEICAVVNKLLAKLPTQRYQQANELVGALLLVAEQLGFSERMHGTVWVSPHDNAPHWYERHLPWMVPTAMLLVIAALMNLSSRPTVQFSQDEMRPRYLVPPTTPQPEAITVPGTNRPQSRDGAASKNESPAVSDSNGGANTAPANSVGSNAENSPPKPAGENTAVALNTTQPSTDNRSATDATTGNNNATTNSDPAAVTTIVIGSADELSPESRVARSLSEALRMLDDFPNATTLELRFNGERQEAPLELPARKLFVRSSSGFKPVIVFRPEQGELALDRRMIRAAAGELVLQGIHLRLELPAEPYDGWALFQLAHGVGLDLSDSSLTIRNADDSGGTLQEKVAFIEISAPMATETTKSSGSEMTMLMTRTAPPVISIANSIIRGQATLLEVGEALPLRMSITQSLVTTTRRMIELGGARQQPKLSDVVQIDLKNVTAFVGEGLGFSKIDPEGSFPLEFILSSHNCIILTGGDAPLLSQRGTAQLPYKKRPNIRGEDNFYPNTKSILLIDATGNPSDLVEYTFSERDEARGEKWYDDHPVPGMVQWKRPPAAGLRVDLHSKDDYLFTPGPDDKTLQTAGFDPLHLLDPPVSERMESSSRSQ